MKPTPLRLDFAPARARPLRGLSIALLVLGLLLASWAAVAVRWRLGELGAGKARLAAASLHIPDDRRRFEPRAVDADTLALIRRAAAVADQLTLPWDELFAAVEAADARPLGLLSMVPNARDRSLRIAGEARSTVDMLAYVERLASQPALAQVHLVGYSSALRDGVPVVVFNLAASWRPRT